MKTWQAMMKHEEDCGKGYKVLCETCPHFERDCEEVECPTQPCTCHRDETVAAIEGVMRAADKVLPEDYCEECAWCSGHARDCGHGKLQAALDRLNALGK